MIVLVLVSCYALFYAALGSVLILRALGLWRDSYHRH
jgi:hypothetical protein